MTAVGMSAYQTMQEKIFHEQAYGKAATDRTENDGSGMNSILGCMPMTRIPHRLRWSGKHEWERAITHGYSVDSSGVTTMVSKRHEENKQ